MSTATRPRTPTDPATIPGYRHPLEDLVLATLRGREGITAEDLAATIAGRPRPPRAYVLVARDVLEQLERAGRIGRNSRGEWRGGPGVAADPTLDIELAARRNCRHGLPGLRVGYRGRQERIDSTSWDADGDLAIRLEGRDEPVGAAECTLLDSWKTVCCKPSEALRRKAIAAKGPAGV